MNLKNYTLARKVEADYATGNHTQTELAAKYNVSQQVISKWIKELKEFDNSNQ